MTVHPPITRYSYCARGTTCIRVDSGYFVISTHPSRPAMRCTCVSTHIPTHSPHARFITSIITLGPTPGCSHCHCGKKPKALSFLTTQIVVKLPCKDRRSSGERGISPPHDLHRVVHVEMMCLAFVLWKETGRMIIASASFPPFTLHHCSKALALKGFRSIATFS